jgi:hypothetical protein
VDGGQEQTPGREFAEHLVVDQEGVYDPLHAHISHEIAEGGHGVRCNIGKFGGNRPGVIKLLEATAGRYDLRAIAAPYFGLNDYDYEWSVEPSQAGHVMSMSFVDAG